MRLFEVQFADGHTVVQDESDRSVTDETRSAWYDVTQYLEHSAPEWFFLKSESGLVEHRLHVPSCTFFAGDIPFRLHGADDLPLFEVEPYFFRRRQIDATFAPGMKYESHVERPIIYRFGFTAKKRSGEDVSFILEVD